MAIKVQGNIVIDDSQNIINIGVATIGSIDVNKISPDGTDFGALSYIPVADGSGTWSWQPITSAGGGTLDGITVQEETSTVGTAGSITTLKFVGNNITATAVAGGAIATITASDTPTFDTLGIGTRIDLIPYDTLDNGTLSFEGSAGQLFSITNNLTSGSIFSVNDVSGIPSIDVDADGTIQLAPFGATEYVGIGTTNPTHKLHVVGDARVTGILTVGSSSITLDGPNNTAHVGTALTLSHSEGLKYHTQSLHATGFEVNNINASGIVTASSFSGDGSNLTGVGGAGLGTALSNDSTNLLSRLYKTEKNFRIPANTQLDVSVGADGGNVAFMKEGLIHVGAGATLHIASGTSLVVDVLGIFS